MKQRVAILFVSAFLAACGDNSPSQPVLEVEAAPRFSTVPGQGGWTASGPGTVNTAGTTEAPSMTYALNGGAVHSNQTWTFSSTSAQSGALTLAYQYTGYHAYFQVRVFARAFITRNEVTTTHQLVSGGPVNCCNAPSGGFGYAGDHTFNLQAGDVFGFEFGGSNGDSDARLLGTFTATYPAPVSVVFTSDPAAVQAWGPVIQAPRFSPWEAGCTVNPGVGLNDARWGAPHAAYDVGTAAFEGWAPWANFDAPWINSWNSLHTSTVPGGQHGSDSQNWSKFASPVSGQGDYVVQFLADNCSWIYLDGTLIGVQGDDWNSPSSTQKGRYSLTLSGEHTLSFIVYDGGGQAGGKFRLETLQSFVGGGGNPGDVTPPLPTDNSAPVITASIAGTLNGDWYTSDAVLTWTVTDAESTVTSTSGCQSSTVNSDTDGITFTCSATSAGGTATESVTIKRDATAPAVAATVAGTQGVDDWYTSDVSVTWTVTEPTSPLTTSGCDAVTVTADTNGETFTCTATSAGGTTEESVTIKRDATPPAVAATVSGTMGDNGWYTADATVTWSVTEPTSPMTTAGCDAVTVTADTDGDTFTCSATSAGGTTQESVTVKRDATDPVIVFSGAVSYTVDQTVAIACSATDAMSGIASSNCPGASGDAYLFAIGTTPLNASASDNAGNASVASTSFTVSVTSGSLCTLVRRWVSQRGIANSMCQQLNNGAYGAFANHVNAQSGKSVSAAHAAILVGLAGKL